MKPDFGPAWARSVHAGAVHRLYPLYLLGTMLGIAVTLASLLGRNNRNWDPSSLFQAALLALLLLPNLSGRPMNQMFPLNIPCWSLFLEILVNFLFVISWPLLTSRRLILVCMLTVARWVWQSRTREASIWVPLPRVSRWAWRGPCSDSRWAC